MVTHQSVLTPISDYFLSSEVATTWQSDSIAYKPKPRLFHKFTHFQANSMDFHSQCEPHLIYGYICSLILNRHEDDLHYCVNQHILELSYLVYS